MKKMLLLLLVLGIFVTAMPEPVEAADSCTSALLGCTNKQSDRCKSGCSRKYQDPAYYLQMGLNIIKYVGVIACIAFTVIDFVKIIVSDDKDGYKKAVSKALKRLIYAAIIFFLPYIIMGILSALNITANSTHGIS